MKNPGRTVALLAALATLGAGFAPLATQASEADPVVPIPDVANPGDAAVAYPGELPGTAQVAPVGSAFRLSNAAISATVTGGTTPGIGQITTHGVAQDLQVTSLFALRLANGTAITPAQTTPGALTSTVLTADTSAARLAERHPGVGTTMAFTYASGGSGFTLHWDTELRDGSNYIRSEFRITDVAGTFDIAELRFLDAAVTGGRNTGKDNGNPIAVGGKGHETLFVGVENPMANQTIAGNAISFPIPRSGDLAAGSAWDYSAVVGASPDGQLRRAFLYYTERERAHARRPFLHYQSWFDLKPPAEVINASELNQAIELFGSEMSDRDATLDSYWIDDGWDYLRSPAAADESNLQVWDFDPTQFPTGFAPQKAIAQSHRGNLSVWMSPFGGYGRSAATRAALNASKPASERLERTPTNKGFALSGERYGARFRDVVYDMLDNQGVRGFKFDGIGGGLHQTGPNLTYLKDYEALLDLMGDMRDHESEVFINTTVGTWGSPYWLWYSDSIWRDGDDAGQVGAGDPREQYINYRDSAVYNYNMTENPLMPLNSIMNHGFIFSDRAPQFDADNDLTEQAVRTGVANDLRGYFAMGLSLQELYVRNTLVNSSAANSDWFWDELAKNARWARNNTALLTDAHWLGKDAAEGQIYGTAAWSDATGEERCMIMLRNPSTEAQTYKLDIGKGLELPARADGRYRLVERDGQRTDIVVEAGRPFYLELQPFEVLLFEGTVASDPLTL